MNRLNTHDGQSRIYMVKDVVLFGWGDVVKSPKTLRSTSWKLGLLKSTTASGNVHTQPNGGESKSLMMA